MNLVDKDKLLEIYDQIHIGPPGNARKMIEAAPAVSDLDIFTDILKRGQVLFRTKKWVSCSVPVTEGECVYIHDGRDEVSIEFNKDGSVCSYEDFEI